MPYNGSGVYQLPAPAYPAIPGTVIFAETRNEIDADIQTALSIAMPRDGQGQLTGDLNFGGFGGTNIATLTAAVGGCTFSGDFFATTQANGDSTKRLATCEFVANQVFSMVLPGQAGNRGKFLGTDGTNPAWAFPGLTSLSAVVTTDTTLTVPGQYVSIQMATLGKSVTLESALTLAAGGAQHLLDNTKGGYPAGVRDNSGALLFAIAPGGQALVSLVTGGTQAGVWSYTGTGIEPALVTQDTTVASPVTGTNTYAANCVLDANTTLHFGSLASGFAAFLVDNLSKVVSAPVTVDATANSAPAAVFKISATQALVFFGLTGTNTHKAAVVTVSGVSPALSLAVGATATHTVGTSMGRWGDENSLDAPHIVQLTTTTYVATYVSGAVTAAVAATVTGAVVAFGAAANIIAANSGTVQAYFLTTTTILALYASGAATPYTANAVVVSVAAGVCTPGVPQAGGTFSAGSPPNLIACLLSATKALVMSDNNDSTTVRLQAVTITTGTTVAFGAQFTLETGASTVGTSLNNYTSSGASRYNPHLFPLSASSALMWYLDNTGISRTAVLQEAAGVVTAPGGILYKSISAGASNANSGGMQLPPGTGEFLAIVQDGNSTGMTFSHRLVPHKISGSTITSGHSRKLEGESNQQVVASAVAVRMTSGDYLAGIFSSTPGKELSVFRSNGDALNARGNFAAPSLSGYNFGICQASANRAVLVGNTSFQGQSAFATSNLRILSVEIAI